MRTFICSHAQHLGNLSRYHARVSTAVSSVFVLIRFYLAWFSTPRSGSQLITLQHVPHDGRKCGCSRGRLAQDALGSCSSFRKIHIKLRAPWSIWIARSGRMMRREGSPRYVVAPYILLSAAVAELCPSARQPESESGEVVDDEAALSRRVHSVASSPVGRRKVIPNRLSFMVCGALCIHLRCFMQLGGKTTRVVGAASPRSGSSSPRVMIFPHCPLSATHPSSRFPPVSPYVIVRFHHVAPLLLTSWFLTAHSRVYLQRGSPSPLRAQAGSRLLGRSFTPSPRGVRGSSSSRLRKVLRLTPTPTPTPQ
jgi:hypothetical protein